MPSLSDVRADLTGWKPKSLVESGASWINAAGDWLWIHHFPTPPDLPGPLEDLTALWDFHRDTLRQTGGTIVELDVVPLAGLRAVRALLKFPQQQAGMAAEALLTLPFEEFSFVLTVRCPGHGTTGVRASDDPRYDAQLPDHPLSRARRHLAQLERTLRVSPALLQARPFTGLSGARRDAPRLLPNPRRHHYEFAHRTLPYLFLKDADAFLARLYEGKKPFLERLWTFVAKDMPPEEFVAPEGLNVGLQFYEDSAVAVVSLPPARAVAEALLVGCHFWTKPDPRQPTRVPARYLTLELGVHEDGSLRTALGEWTASGNRSNYGNGPRPNPEDFIAAIRSLVQHP